MAQPPIPPHNQSKPSRPVSPLQISPPASPTIDASRSRVRTSSSPSPRVARSPTSRRTSLQDRSNVDTTSTRPRSRSTTTDKAVAESPRSGLPRMKPMDVTTRARAGTATPFSSERSPRSRISSVAPSTSVAVTTDGVVRPLFARAKSGTLATSPRRTTRPRPAPPPFSPKTEPSPRSTVKIPSPGAAKKESPTATTRSPSSQVTMRDGSPKVRDFSPKLKDRSPSTSMRDVSTSSSSAKSLSDRRGSGTLMRVMLPQESGGGFLTIKYEDNDTMDMVMAKVLQHTNSKRVGRRSSLVFTKEDFELSSSPSAPAAGSAIPSNQSTLYLRYTSDNEMCLQIEGLLMANNRLLCSDKDVKAIGTGFSPSTCWRISRAPRHAVYLQDMQQRNLCSEPDGRVFLGTPGPSINWGQELWTITDNFLVNAYGKYLSVSSSGGLSCVDSKSEAKVIPVGDEVLEGYVYKCGIFRGNNPILLYFVLSQQGLSTYISKEAYLMARHIQVAPSLPFSSIESAQLDNNTCCIRLKIKTEDLSLQHLMCRSAHEATMWLRALNKQPIVSGTNQLSSILSIWDKSLDSGMTTPSTLGLTQLGNVPATNGGPAVPAQTPIVPPPAVIGQSPVPLRHHGLPPPPPCRPNGSTHSLPTAQSMYSQAEAHVKSTSFPYPQRSCTSSTFDHTRRNSLPSAESALASLSLADPHSHESSTFSGHPEPAGSSGRRSSGSGPQSLETKSMVHFSPELAAFDVPTRARRASLAFPPPPPPTGILKTASDAHTSATVSPNMIPASPPSSPDSPPSSSSSASRSSASCSYLYSSMSSLGVPSASSSQLFASPLSRPRSVPSSPECVSIHETQRERNGSIPDLSVWLPPSQHSAPLRAVPATEAELKEFIKTLHAESVTLRSVMTTKQKKLQTLVAEKEAKMAALQQLGPKAAITLQRERQRRYCSNEELAMKIVHLKKQLRTVLHGFDVEEEVSLSDSEAGE